MGRCFLTLQIAFALYLVVLIQPVEAVSIPSFPTCANPQGTIKASYSSGTHGVPGDQTTYTGADTVYRLSDDTLMQCLCPTTGDGIQTNWMKSRLFTELEIRRLLNRGWIFIPDGSVWGLTYEPYLAKNSTYACHGSADGRERGMGASSGTARSSNQSLRGETIKGVSQVRGLASTGNATFIAALYVGAFVCILVSVVLRRMYLHHNK
jgi:hypothetical protein